MCAVLLQSQFDVVCERTGPHLHADYSSMRHLVQSATRVQLRRGMVGTIPEEGRGENRRMGLDRRGRRESSKKMMSDENNKGERERRVGGVGRKSGAGGEGGLGRLVDSKTEEGEESKFEGRSDGDDGG